MAEGTIRFERVSAGHYRAAWGNVRGEVKRHKYTLKGSVWRGLITLPGGEEIELVETYYLWAQINAVNYRMRVENEKGAS